jgi:hypothetical protein
MRYIPFAQADSYYDVAGRARLNWRSIEHEGVERLSEAVFKLSKLSRQQDDDTGWRRFLYPARRARNIVTTVPLPFDSAATGLEGLMHELEGLLPMLRVYAGEDAGLLGEEVVAAGIDLAGLTYSPLLQVVAGLADDGNAKSTGLLLPMGDFLGSVRDHLNRQFGEGRAVLKPLTWHSLSDSEVFDRLIVIGPLYWYRDHEFVLTSPRAQQIELIKWAWYSEQPPVTHVLEGSSGLPTLSLVPPPARTQIVITESDERQEIDWNSVSRELAGRSEGELAEFVTARPVLLAGGFAALFPEEGERLVWLLDPDGQAERRVVRVDVSDLEPGHVVMFRTSGGGDLIVPLADEILGHDADYLRELQRTWKANLRTWVFARGGLHRAAAELQRMGGARAYPQNVKNWLADRSLRPDDRGDWRVLMRAASLETRSEEIWQAMGRLLTAHHEAGTSLGRRLRDVANTADLDELLSRGRQVFTQLHGGSLTALRIEEFASLTVSCPSSHLMTPTKMRKEWLI